MWSLYKGGLLPGGEGGKSPSLGIWLQLYYNIPGIARIVKFHSDRTKAMQDELRLMSLHIFVSDLSQCRQKIAFV